MNQQVLYKETRFKRIPSDSLDVIYNIPEKSSPVYTKIGTIKRKPIYFVNRNPSPNDDSPGPGPYYKKLSWEKNISSNIIKTFNVLH